MATDFLGNEINVGDSVVFMQLRYRSLVKGKIIRLTEKMAIIEHKKTNVYSTESKQYHNQMIKIPIPTIKIEKDQENE